MSDIIDDYTKRLEPLHRFEDKIASLMQGVWSDGLGFINHINRKYPYVEFLDTLQDESLQDKVLEYFEKNVIPHKIAVYNAGVDLMSKKWIHHMNINKVQFLKNLYLHDMSKFSGYECFAYAQKDFSKKEKSPDFEAAWNHHKNSNPHHPEYWLNTGRDGTVEPIPMPQIYVLEMIADWIGAGVTYGQSLEQWLPKNLGKFLWHKETAMRVKFVLTNLGIKVRVDGEKLSIMEQSEFEENL